MVDGDVLEMRPQSEEQRPAVVEDVRDAVEDSVDAAGGVWTTQTTRSQAVLGGALALALIAALASAGLGWGWGRLDEFAAPVPAALAVLSLQAACWWGAFAGRDLDAQVATAVSMWWAALLVVSVLSDPVENSMKLLAAVMAVAIAAGSARAITPAVTGHLSFAATLLAAAGIDAGVSALGIDAVDLRRVLPVLALLTLGVLPRLSLSVGGLASADYRVRHVGRLELAALRARYRASNAILVGAVAGIGVLVLVCGGLLVVDGDPWDRTLALLLGLTLVLRSRIFSRVQHMVAPRVLGTALLMFGLGHAMTLRPGLLMWFPVVVALAVVAAIGLSGVSMSEISRARVKRLLNLAEFLTVVVLLVVMFGALGVYGVIGGLFQ